MSVAALKKEAIRLFAKKIETIRDENVLKMIIDFLDGIDDNDKDAINLSRHYEKIKAKYGSVLRKLAE